MVMQSARDLARTIKESDEYRAYQQAKEALEDNETSQALLKEYRKMQMKLQMAALAQQNLDADETQRFSQLSALLFAGTDTSAYLMSEMRLQQLMAQVFQVITEAAGLPMEIPGIG